MSHPESLRSGLARKRSTIRGRIHLLVVLLVCAQALLAQVPNDMCSSAIPITCGSVTAGTSIDADFDLDAASCDVGPMAPGVWYTFSGIGGSMMLSTCPASYATILNLYSGACGDLVCVASNFMGDSCAGSHIDFEADPGQTYFVLVNGFYGSTGDFDLSLQPKNGGCAPIRAFLDGPFDPATGLMSDSLRTLPGFPLDEPYTALGYVHVGGGGGESIAPTVLLATGVDAIVDWVVLELRDKMNPGKRVKSVSALIQRDGDLVGLDGTSPVQFGSSSGAYFLALRHRNHLGVMSAAPVSFPDPRWDITVPGPLTWGRDSRKTVGDVQTMWSGDVTFDGQVKYTGSDNDRDPILQAIGGTTPNNTTTGYAQTDVNLNGRTGYTGSGNDRDRILVTVGGSTPNNVRKDFLPLELQLHDNIHIHVVDTIGWVLDSALSNMPNGLYAFQFNGAAPNIVANDIIVSGTMDGGYLRKVISASVDGSIVTVQTVQGCLADVFAEGVLNFNIPMSDLADENAVASLMPNTSGIDLNVTDVALFHVGGIILPDADEQALILKKGRLAMDPDINLNFEFDPFTGVKTTELTTRGSNMTAEMVLSAKFTVSLDTTVNVELLKKSIPVVYIVPIGLGAIPIYVEYKVNVDAEAKLKLTDVISMRDTVRTTMSCDLGLVYDGQAHSYNNSTGTFYAGGEVTQFSPSLGIKVAFKEKVTASLFGLLGPFLSLSIPEASARGTIALPSLDFDASVKASVKLETGIDLTTISGATTVLGGGLWESDSLFWRTPNKVEIVFGNDQVGQPDSTLTDSLAVKVTSTLGAPQKNVHVHFEVTAGGGSLSQQVVDTDAEGVARCTWTLGPETLPDQRVKAWARFGNGDTLVGGPLLFKAEFAELQAEVYAGDDQVAHLSDPLPAPIMVRVVDQDDVPYAGIMVHFEIASGGGELTVDSVITDADGLAGSDWTLGSNELDQQLVHAWATTSQHDTLPPGILTFNAHFPYNIMDYADVHDFDGDVGDDMPPMRVYVGDQLGLPQFNIPVHFTVVSGSGGSLSQTLVHTDAQGIATCNWNLGAFTAHTQVVKAWSLDQDGDTLLGGPLYFTATEPGVCTVLGSFPGMANYGEVLQINVLATGIYTGTPLQGIGAGLTTWRGADIPNPPGGGTTGPDGIAVVGWQMVAYNTGGQHAKLVCLGDTTLFSTSLPNCTGTVEDVDGNEYPIGWVGCHCAMLKNLRTTHFTNGDSIPFGTNAEWDGADTTFQALADHVNSDEANDDQYGLLYNFEAAITHNSIRQLCPDGWGIPDAYFANVAGGMNEVITSLGGPSIAGGKLKATTLWDPPNFGASNSTGFSAYPAGSRTPGGPQDMGIFGRFWTHQATLFGNAYFLQLSTYSEAVQTQYTSRKNGLSCRCWNNYKRDME